ncbi:MAG: hypothetical protein EU548_03570 [Promethearchaeota archaeon]|nr:MAG: hypothetical protein EU548_03570 [Candidatus Lokiarchaeota archaeon]
MRELFCTNVGSHIWKMNHKNSDIDLVSVYMMDSKNFLLGKQVRGKQKKDGDIDLVIYEIGHVIHHLLKGNCNFLWCVMSPIVVRKYRNALNELREVVANNLAKNCYNSINGLAKHNIYHYIEKGDRQSLLHKKKLNVIGRTLKFGINLLTWGKCMFQKVDIENEEELYLLKEQLNKAYMYSTLPEKPNKEPFEKYLIRWRLKKMREDEMIE